MYERERERGGGAIHVLLFHSIFVVAFILSFSLLYAQYTYSGFVTKLTSSAVTLISAKPLRVSHNPRLSGLGLNTTLVF